MASTAADAPLADSYVGRFTPGRSSAPEHTANGELDSGSHDVPRWPAPLGEAAFHGLAGDFVRTVAPHSEADPAALLVSFLVAAGSMVGRHVYCQREGDRHYCNLFALIVGATSGGRKGTAWGRVRRLAQLVDPLFAAPRGNTKTGLVSGEGLIHHVRDPDEKPGRPTKNGEPTIRDPGVADKRLLVYESEFAQVITRMGREGNTLSATLRSAWDTGDLATLGKLQGETATDAHVAIVGNITPSELRDKLKSVELTNGFANRFLVVASRQSKDLPYGGDLPEQELEELAARLRRVVNAASVPRRLEMGPDAATDWERAYLGELKYFGTGAVLEAATSRAAPQALRLACLYAVLDRADQIRRPHLNAALAVWRYCFDSAAYMLKLATGNPTADTILAALDATPGGLTRTEISALFNRNEKATEITAALTYLQDRGKASRPDVRPEPARPGRHAERWYSTKHTKEMQTPCCADVAAQNSSSLSSNSLPLNGTLADAGSGLYETLAF